MATWQEISGQQEGNRRGGPSRIGRRRGLRPDSEGRREWWVLEPKLLPHRGRVLEVYGIATTAFVLGVSPITQRRWEACCLPPTGLNSGARWTV